VEIYMLTRIDLIAALAASAGITLAVVSGPDVATLPAPAAEQTVEVSFADDILPMFEASCFECHGAEVDGVVVTEASLNLTTYELTMAGSEFGTVVEAGEPDESILLVLVEDGDMPDEGDKLSPEQIELIRNWIAEGANNN
jgi:mono/diheme cytochrome c family protein